MLTFVLVAVLVLATPLAVWCYLSGLPVAPLCPVCSAVTLARGVDAGRGALPQIGLTSSRECTHCGWHGRMRWRWAQDRARDE